MRCDMHVHTSQSGMCTIPLLNRVCRECYSDPLEVYEVLKRRGMDLVTITDHDSIGALGPLGGRPGFFLSEEISCTTPSGTSLHMGVYGIEEWHHAELQRRRDDLVSLIAFLTEQNLFFTINHVFSALTGPRADLDFGLFEDHFPGMETLNGAMLESCNGSAAELARRVSGSYVKLTRTVIEIGCSLIRERRWTALLAPLLFAIPAVTLANALRETAFHRQWSRRLGIGIAASATADCAPEIV